MKKSLFLFLMLFITVTSCKVITTTNQNFKVTCIEINNVLTDTILCKNIKILNDSIIYLDDKPTFNVSNFWEENGVVYYDLYMGEIPVGATLFKKYMYFHYMNGTIKYKITEIK